MASIEGKGYYHRRRFEGGTELTPPLDTGGINVRPMSGIGNMKVQGERKGFFKRIYASGDPGRSWRPDTGKTPAIVFCTQLLDEPGILSSSGRVFPITSINLIEYFA